MGSSDSPQTVRVELSSEADLFFHYIHYIDDNGNHLFDFLTYLFTLFTHLLMHYITCYLLDFSRIKESQKLMVAFNDYPTVLVRMLNACIREPHTHFGIFVLLNENDARLDFIQNMEYKYIELMSCNCIQSPSELVQQHITYRYNSMKQKLAIMQSRLHEINTLVKTKNPSLLLQLNRNVPNSPGATSSSSSTNRR